MENSYLFTEDEIKELKDKDPAILINTANLLMEIANNKLREIIKKQEKQIKQKLIKNTNDNSRKK